MWCIFIDLYMIIILLYLYIMFVYLLYTLFVKTFYFVPFLCVLRRSNYLYI
nr:MAG TPA: hypothetical protein [Caudoviricetes sp.]